MAHYVISCHSRAAFSSVLEPDVSAGHVASESTDRLSIQPLPVPTSFLVELTKRYRLRSASSSDDIIPFSTVLRVELDPTSHRVLRMTDQWQSPTQVLPDAGTGSGAEAVPEWVRQLAEARRSAGLQVALAAP